MNAKEFEDLIDRHGEDFSRWPDILREAAAALLASSPAARAILDDARLIRETLVAPAIRAPIGLADRIFAAARLSERAAADRAAVDN